jgi:hypothetical protein
LVAETFLQLVSAHDTVFTVRIANAVATSIAVNSVIIAGTLTQNGEEHREKRK